ncbi:MAG: calcium/sodium antiporter [Patescibacteria group bacterium]|jgi:cation:H+ antiporter
MLIIWSLVFILTLIILIKAADYFTEAAEKIGLSLKIPVFVVGATIVTFGTTLPEFGTAIMALLKGQTQLIAANAIGSNIANILLVIGITAIVAGLLKVKKRIIDVDFPLLAASTALIIAMLWDKKVTFGEGLVALLAYAVYLAYLIHTERHAHLHPEGTLPGEDLPLTRAKRHKYQQKERRLILGLVPTLLVSLVFVYFSADWLVRSIMNLADLLNVSSALVATLGLAIGTSLPELVIAITAVKKGQYEIALGNVFGANIFNSLVVIGLPALFTDLQIDNLTFTVGIPFLVGATFLYIFSAISKKIHRWDGIIYLLIYAFFVAKMIGWL